MRSACWTALALALCELSCAGTETGNPSIVEAQLALGAHSSDPSLVAIRSSAGGIVVDAVWLSLGPVGLVRGADCASPSDRYESAALGSADHSGSDAAILNVQLESGAYCGLTVAFRTDAAPPAAAPSGAPILILGHLADATPFSVTSDAEGVVAVPSVSGGFALDPAASALLVGFDVARWIGSLDFRAAEREPDGSITIDRTKNADLLSDFEAALASGIEVYRDRDEDGALDDPPELVARGELP